MSLPSDAALDFLRSVFSSRSQENAETHRPLVTLTFAQSLDAKIAGNGRRQLLLSCPESMLMTHWMRSMHDAILVGIGTALNDNPQLNTRLIPEVSRPSKSPRPVILDAELRLPIDCKLLSNFRQGRGLQPWIFCSSSNFLEMSNRKFALLEAGAIIFNVTCENGFLSIPQVLEELYNQGIRSLMVEGGATVINNFLKCTQQSHDSTVQPIVDTIIITTAPMFVGDGGVGYEVSCAERAGEVPTLQRMRTVLMGTDTVTAVRILRRQ
ncbi:dihydrofolate reductase-like domain-containing protein [Pisolithus croceorrhizus]|nr:dihydrofolate reductase-like domain-containing protein [Pisolithus croceorrhizus]